MEKQKNERVLVNRKNKLTSEEASWLACAIDADGTLKFYHKERHGHWDGWEFCAIVCNTNRNFVKKAESLLSRFGKVYKQVPDRRGKKPIYWIKLSSGIAVKGLCYELLPYLIVKKKNALKILLYKKRVMDKGWRKSISNAISIWWRKKKSSLQVEVAL